LGAAGSLGIDPVCSAAMFARRPGAARATGSPATAGPPQAGSRAQDEMARLAQIERDWAFDDALGRDRSCQRQWRCSPMNAILRARSPHPTLPTFASMSAHASSPMRRRSWPPTLPSASSALHFRAPRILRRFAPGANNVDALLRGTHSCQRENDRVGAGTHSTDFPKLRLEVRVICQISPIRFFAFSMHDLDSGRPPCGASGTPL
jgi:hypothetical protein